MKLLNISMIWKINEVYLSVHIYLLIKRYHTKPQIGYTKKLVKTFKFNLRHICLHHKRTLIFFDHIQAGRYPSILIWLEKFCSPAQFISLPVNQVKSPFRFLIPPLKTQIYPPYVVWNIFFSNEYDFHKQRILLSVLVNTKIEIHIWTQSWIICL